MTAKSVLRRGLRTLGQRFPVLRRYSGRLGLGRLLTSGNVQDQIVIDGDIKIELDLSIPFYRVMYFFDHFADMEETILFRKLLGREDVVVDAGAHIGYFSLVAAKYAGHVLAIEPGPANCARLERNLQCNPGLTSKISIHKVGLSDSQGTMTLYASRSEPATTSFRPDLVAEAVPTTVPVVTLDSLVADRHTSFIKIDVEGAELDVLKGAGQVIARDKPLVLCELNVRAQRAFGRACNDITQFFEDNGYVGFRTLRDSQIQGRLWLEGLDESMFKADTVMNGFYIPSSQVAEVIARLG